LVAGNREFITMDDVTVLAAARDPTGSCGLSSEVDPSSDYEIDEVLKVRMGIKRTTLISRMKKLGIEPRSIS
jgi:hypothetical protein